MAVNRKITFNTSVYPQETTTISEVPGSLEEYDITKSSYTDYKTISSMGKLGGHGICTSLNVNQWGDGWTSMTSSLLHGLNWEANGTEWESADFLWDTGAEDGISLTTSPTQLTTDINDLSFLYIKNIGSTNTALVSLNGTSGNYYIQIPPSASVHLRGDGTNLECNEVYVKSDSGTTNIEYIIAKE